MKIKVAFLAVAALITTVIPASATAQESAFSIQVSPSPVVEVLKPGDDKDIELKVRNDGTATEKLKVELRKFEVDSASGEVKISDEEPEEVKSWITISDPNFTVEAKTWFTQKLHVVVSPDLGFNYSFVLMITRQDAPVKQAGQSSLVGSVAVFVLLSVEKPGATREFNLVEFKSNKRLYDYLPAEFDIKLSNTGNTMLLPYGNIYIQRGDGENEDPIAVLPLNANAGYLLPGVSRSFQTFWEDGFPKYTLKREADNVEITKKLTWDFSKVQNLRIGKYTAKMVAVYNDGTRDVPVEASVTFWVIPWRPILVIVVVLVLVLIGLMSTGKSVFGRFKRKKKPQHDKKTDKQT